MVTDVIHPQVPRSQFSLRDLFIGLTLVCGCLGLAMWIGLFAVVLFYFAALIVAACCRWISGQIAAGAIVLSFVLLVVISPAFFSIGHDANWRRYQCRNNLRNIGVALQAYKIKNGR